MLTERTGVMAVGFAGLPARKKMSITENSYWCLVSVSPWAIAWAGYELISGERRDALPWVALILSIAALIIGVTGLIVQRSRRH
ncbi:hypothetical protein [Micromonospora sp. NPDC049204]|uniref:hypothetical protein n=1 Tax=unclassified Micromonospora TaxID=2617518 RepID=UPI0033FFE4AF